MPRQEGGRWPLAAGRWPLAAGRWPLAAGRWPLAAGRWPLHTARAKQSQYDYISTACGSFGSHFDRRTAQLPNPLCRSEFSWAALYAQHSTSCKELIHRIGLIDCSPRDCTGQTTGAPNQGHDWFEKIEACSYRDAERVSPVSRQKFRIDKFYKSAKPATVAHALTFASLLLLAPALALARQNSANVGDLIQCTDWRLYAPPVVRNTEAPDQTPVVFQTRPPAPQSAPTGNADQTCRHMIAAGETLAQIAARHLGNASRWQDIVAANPGMDPDRLAVRRSIVIPCHRPSGAGQRAAAGQQANPDQPRRGLWATLFGGRSATSSHTATDQVTPASGPAPDGQVGDPAPIIEPHPGSGAVSGPVAPLPPPPAPIWTASQGEHLEDILLRWGSAAGWTVLIDTHETWQLKVPVSIQGAFEEAVGELIRGLGHGGIPPRVRMHPNNVIRLGGPL